MFILVSETLRPLFACIECIITQVDNGGKDRYLGFTHTIMFKFWVQSAISARSQELGFTDQLVLRQQKVTPHAFVQMIGASCHFYEQQKWLEYPKHRLIRQCAKLRKRVIEVECARSRPSTIL